MAIIMETTLGDLVFDLYTEERPNSCLNFLKLCKKKYYNFCLFHSIRRNFIAQSGDPTGSGKGGESVFGMCHGSSHKYFPLEVKPRIRHKTKGTISFVNNGNDMHGSQFFITLGDGLDFLDGKHTVFGQLAEGFDVLEKLNESICDDSHKPYQDVRINHTIILEDPFDDPKGFTFSDKSPEPTKEQLDSGYIGADEAINFSGKSKEEIEKAVEDKDLTIGAKILETIGDIPDADLKPPENVLFVCKLNPVTNADDLKIIFSRFGKIISCEIIKDQKTGDSLGYGFIEFDKIEDCEKAYFKMDNVLIDDRRIHVDFCQSVAKLKWKKSANYRKAVVEQENRHADQGYKLKTTDVKRSDKYEMVFEEDEDSGKRAKVKSRASEVKDSKLFSPSENVNKKSRRVPEKGSESENEIERDRDRLKLKRRKDRSASLESGGNRKTHAKRSSVKDRSRSPQQSKQTRKRKRTSSSGSSSSADVNADEQRNQRRKVTNRDRDRASSDSENDSSFNQSSNPQRKKGREISSDDEVSATRSKKASKRNSIASRKKRVSPQGRGKESAEDVADKPKSGKNPSRSKVQEVSESADESEKSSSDSSAEDDLNSKRAARTDKHHRRSDKEKRKSREDESEDDSEVVSDEHDSEDRKDARRKSQVKSREVASSKSRSKDRRQSYEERERKSTVASQSKSSSHSKRKRDSDVDSSESDDSSGEDRSNHRKRQSFSSKGQKLQKSSGKKKKSTSSEESSNDD